MKNMVIEDQQVHERKALDFRDKSGGKQLHNTSLNATACTDKMENSCIKGANES
jgi:hypothetical protein